MQMTALAPHCGVEVSGVQLAEATGDAALLDEIRTAVWEHGVAVFRDQDFGPQEHIAFARAWGGIDINNYFPLTDAFPEIAVVGKRADQTTNIGGGWHTDHSYDQIPAMGSILVARELPPTGGDTLFAHMGAAYDALSDDLKTEIEGLEAFHSADLVYSPDGYYAQTGRKLLYVNAAFTTHIVGRTREESMPLLQRLFATALSADNTARVEWQPGSVAIWDNRTTWHMAMNDYQGHARTMHRITLTGEALAA